MWTVNGELEADPCRKVNPDHLELRTNWVNEAVSIWGWEFPPVDRGMEGCGGSQEQGLGANTPTSLAARPNGLLPPGWVLGTGPGGEQNSLMVFPKTMRRSRPWGCWLLDLLLACRSDAKAPWTGNQWDSTENCSGIREETINPGNNRKKRGRVEERVCLLNVDLVKVSDKSLQKSLAAHRISEDQKDQVLCSVQGIWNV